MIDLMEILGIADELDEGWPIAGVKIRALVGEHRKLEAALRCMVAGLPSGEIGVDLALVAQKALGETDPCGCPAYEKQHRVGCPQLETK